MSAISDAEIPLARITGLSPLNPRQDMQSDISTLAATIRARGLLHPILVEANCPTDDGQPSYAVLAGGRRWRALRALAADDSTIPLVKVRIFRGLPPEAREAALAEAVTQKPLHPVEEFEAFSELEKSGFDVPTIARDFALSERHVKQRLALGNLSPRVRNLWRDGAIDRDQASAFTSAGVEAQEALLDSEIWVRGDMRGYAIRRSLLADALDASEDPDAQFILNNAVALDHYRAAGGRIDEELFTGAILLDGALARDSVAAACRAEAKRLCAQEGWGAALVCDDKYHQSAVASDYTAKEQNWLDANEAEIDETLRQAKSARAAGDEEAAAELDAQTEALEAQREEVETKALLRAVSKKARKDLCIFVDAKPNGAFEIIRAVRKPAPAGSTGPSAAAGDDDGGSVAEIGAAPDARNTRDRKQPEPPPLPPPPGGKDAQAVINEALGEALSRATARNLNLALALAVAALGCSHGRAGVGLRLESGPGAPVTHCELLERIEHQRFETALAIVAGAPLCDLSIAFAELVGDAVDFSTATPAGKSNILTLATKLCDITGDLCDVLDYKTLFEAAPRDEALKAIRALDGEAAAAEASKLRKPKLIERAALLARDRHWLPDAIAALFASTPKDERTTAEAMADAIASDEAASRGDDEDPENE